MQILLPQTVTHTHTGIHTQLLAASLNGKMLLSPLTYNLAGKKHTHTHAHKGNSERIIIKTQKQKKTKYTLRKRECKKFCIHKTRREA